jgi:hypothetical protein
MSCVVCAVYVVCVWVMPKQKPLLVWIRTTVALYSDCNTHMHMSYYHVWNRSYSLQIRSYSLRRYLPVSGNVLCRIITWRTNAPLASTSMHHKRRISQGHCKKKVRACVCMYVRNHGVSLMCTDDINQLRLTKDVLYYMVRIPTLFPR